MGGAKVRKMLIFNVLCMVKIGYSLTFFLLACSDSSQHDASLSQLGPVYWPVVTPASMMPA
jgi:hypothetical protein